MILRPGINGENLLGFRTATIASRRRLSISLEKTTNKAVVWWRKCNFCPYGCFFCSSSLFKRSIRPNSSS
jgi:hypothetical protein